MGISYNTSIVRDGLVLHLDAANVKSYSGTGTTWNDLSGLGNNAILVNSPIYSNVNNGTLSFDGTNDHAQLGNASKFIGASQSAITINFWVKTNVIGGYKKIFYTGPAGSSGVSGLYLSIGPSPYQTYFGVITNISNQSADYAASLSTTQYSNLCGTYDGSNIRLYLNGNLVAIKPLTGNIVNTGIARISGYDIDAEVWNGNISAAAFYNQALSQSDIRQNFEALRGRYGI